MTTNEFNEVCNKYLIHPSIALENDEIIAAIHQNDIQAVEDCLRDNFQGDRKMKYCTNKDCPSMHCARQLVSRSATNGEKRYEFELREEREPYDLVSHINGKTFAFLCEGYLRGTIA